MPTPGKQWRHVVFTTLGSWLPGDPRGFRTREHKVHSSGDYKKPPPNGEHAELFKYSKEITPEKVLLPRHLWRTIGLAIRRELLKPESSAPSKLKVGVADFVAWWETFDYKEVSHEQEVRRASVG